MPGVSDVTLCDVLSLFVQVNVVPTLTVRFLGRYLPFEIDIVVPPPDDVVAGLALLAAGEDPVWLPPPNILLSPRCGEQEESTSADAAKKTR
jgi:hypothetical protein